MTVLRIPEVQIKIRERNAFENGSEGPRLVVPHSTCPSLSPSTPAHSFIIGPAVINTHTSGRRVVRRPRQQSRIVLPPETGEQPSLSSDLSDTPWVPYIILHPPAPPPPPPLPPSGAAPLEGTLKFTQQFCCVRRTRHVWMESHSRAFYFSEQSRVEFRPKILRLNQSAELWIKTYPCVNAFSIALPTERPVIVLLPLLRHGGQHDIVREMMLFIGT